MGNRYRVQLKHPTEDGRDIEINAINEDYAAEVVLINVAPGSYVERVVPLEMNYVPPPTMKEIDDGEQVQN